MWLAFRGFRVFPGAVHGQFGRDGLSQDDRARGTEQGDRHGVLGGLAARVEARAVLGGHVGGVKDILDAHGQPVEGTKQSPLAQRAVPIRGLCERTLGVEERPGPHARLERLDTVEARANERHGADLTLPDSLDGVAGSEGGQVAHSGSVDVVDGGGTRAAPLEKDRLGRDRYLK